MAINHDGSKMVAICHEKKIRIYDLTEKTEVCIQEDNAITSLALSKDSKTALVNVAAQVFSFECFTVTKLVGDTFMGLDRKETSSQICWPEARPFCHSVVFWWPRL